MCSYFNLRIQKIDQEKYMKSQKVRFLFKLLLLWPFNISRSDGSRASMSSSGELYGACGRISTEGWVDVNRGKNNYVVVGDA